MEDYSKYEGKKVKVIYDIDGYNEEFEAVVSGCEYDIGISIEVVDVAEKKHMEEFFGANNYYIVCLAGPTSKEYQTIWYSGREDIYEQIFRLYLTYINEGVLSVRNEKANTFGFKSLCGFNRGQMAECSFK